MLENIWKHLENGIWYPCNYVLQGEMSNKRAQRGLYTNRFVNSETALRPPPNTLQYIQS